MTILLVGDWRIDPAAGAMMRNDETVRLEPRMLRLLLCLAGRAGELVGTEELLERVWPGVIVTPDSVYQAIASLRRLLGDNPRDPAYIVTVPRQGYRMIAAVGPAPPDADDATAVAPTIATRTRTLRFAALAAGFAILIAAVVLARSAFERAPPVAEASVAVLPFLDLTEEMAQEYFADGMTEELIDKFSQIPGLRVPPPTASFYFKGKQMTVADIAAQLGVAYVLDGSVRKSGATVRVAARLVRARDGFVVWAQTYDRDAGDLIRVQDDIAGEVGKALAGRIGPATTAESAR